MGDVKTVVLISSQDASIMITRIQMVLLVLTILLTAECSALLVIAIRQEMMLGTLLRQSGARQDTLALTNPETRSQVGNYRNGSEN
jgi:hypothetical protein